MQVQLNSPHVMDYAPIGRRVNPTQWNPKQTYGQFIKDLQRCPVVDNIKVELPPLPDYNLQDPRNTTIGRENRYYGVTADAARDAPFRYRYMRDQPIVYTKQYDDGTIDTRNAAYARMRCRDEEQLARLQNHQGNNMGYLMEELDAVEKYYGMGWWGNNEYPL